MYSVKVGIEFPVGVDRAKEPVASRHREEFISPYLKHPLRSYEQALSERRERESTAGGKLPSDLMPAA